MTQDAGADGNGGLIEGRSIRALHPLLKLTLEIGPLVVFFVANQRAGIFMATGLFMATVCVSLVVSYALTRHLPLMPLVTAAVVLVFGGLTIWLHDDLFIKLKPTIVNSLFGATLLIGLAFGRPLLPYVLDTVFQLTDEGWRKLTFRWGLFFFVLAALNEIVWRTQATDVWVNFKVFGIMPLTMVFALAQTPLILRHDASKGADEA
ncbi:septation protein A [Alsobacter sp. SYSU M60028]|uniref:Inner membrane-spanning protein YciB n=1 Tax=Alsobacter ponti TaxID=2962936 RepID=A0ABT1LGE4_9HYPH|nr:septation protein A [Alsobacter ponti]MCP8940519.1 septation protein A [Alsobacter ponti]